MERNFLLTGFCTEKWKLSLRVFPEYCLKCSMANKVTPCDHGNRSKWVVISYRLKVNLSKLSGMVMCMLSLTVFIDWVCPPVFLPLPWVAYTHNK